MQTLSRMTGKDFSGPTPEIRAPTPLRLPQDSGRGEAQDDAVKVRKHSATPALGEADEEVLGEIDDIGAEVVESNV